jgi:hypothetical protein
MSAVNLFRGLRLIAAGAALSLLLLACGCSSPAVEAGENTAVPTGQHPSDQSGQGQSGQGQPGQVQSGQVQSRQGQSAASSEGAASAVPDPAKADPGLPFRDGENLPAGTMITVRLQKDLTADNPDSSTTFDAVVDHAIVVEGATLVTRGANVMGRVESANASMMKQDQGYVRLTLATLSIGGRDLPVQTASLFARGNAAAPRDSENEAAKPVVHLEKGRRLTFRLTEPVLLASQQGMPGH